MKAFVIATCFVALLGHGASSAQTVFSVSPGSQLNSASIGSEFGSVTLLGGFDYFMASAKTEYGFEEWNQDWNDSSRMYLARIKTLDLDASAKFLIPHIAAKLNLGTGTVRPYVQMTLFKVIPMISLSGTFEETSYSSDGSVSWHDEWDIGDEDSQDTIDEIKDALSAVGFSIGFGSEYYFSDEFSLGGEFGIRLMKFSHTGNLSFEEENGGEIYSRDILSNDMAMTLGLSYSTLSLNYYF